MIAQGRFDFAVFGFIGLVLAQLPLLWPVIRTGGPKPLDPNSLAVRELAGL